MPTENKKKTPYDKDLKSLEAVANNGPFFFGLAVKANGARHPILDDRDDITKKDLEDEIKGYLGWATKEELEEILPHFKKHYLGLKIISEKAYNNPNRGYHYMEQMTWSVGARRAGITVEYHMRDTRPEFGEHIRERTSDTL